MLILIGLMVVVLGVLFKRSTEIITVHPLRGLKPPAPVGGVQDVPDFARLLNTIQQAASAPSEGRIQIAALIRDNQFIEAIQLYRRLYRVDLKTAKAAIDKMMLEQ